MKATLAVPSCALMQPLSSDDRTRINIKKYQKMLVVFCKAWPDLQPVFACFKERWWWFWKSRRKGREVRGSGNQSSKSGGLCMASGELPGNLMKAIKLEDSYNHLNSHDKWSNTTICSKNGLSPCTIFTYKQEEAAAATHALAGQWSTLKQRPFCDYLYYYNFFSSFLTEQTRLDKCSTPYWLA